MVKACKVRVRPGVARRIATFCPHCIYVFCMDLRTNSDYFPIQHFRSNTQCHLLHTNNYCTLRLCHFGVLQNTIKNSLKMAGQTPKRVAVKSNYLTKNRALTSVNRKARCVRWQTQTDCSLRAANSRLPSARHRRSSGVQSPASCERSVPAQSVRNFFIISQDVAICPKTFSSSIDSDC